MMNIKKTWLWNLLMGVELPYDLFKKNGLLIVIIFVFIMLHITNRYDMEKQRIEIKKLEVLYTDARYEYLSLSSILMERGLQSHVEEYVSKHNDKIEIAVSPVYVIE